MKKSCPNCFSPLKLNGSCPNCGYKDDTYKPIRFVWKFIIGYAIFQLCINSFIDYIRDDWYGLLAELIWLSIAWLAVLFIPCVIRYGFKKRPSKKMSVIITTIQGFILFLGNCIIDIIIKAGNPTAYTTTVWNLLMIITPYYIMTDEPIFSTNNSKKK